MKKSITLIVAFVFFILFLNSLGISQEPYPQETNKQNGFTFWKNKIKDKFKVKVQYKDEKKEEDVKKDAPKETTDIKVDENIVLLNEGIPPVLKERIKNNDIKFNDFSLLVKAAEKAVVNISGKIESEKQIKIEGNESKIEPKAMSLGSGFIINKEGYILTNNHVVEKAKDIKVRFDGEQEQYEAKIIGKDPAIDVALLKIESNRRNYNFLYLGNSDNLKVGESVIAIGNQFQLGQTVTSGIVSATSRQVQGNQGSVFSNYIQTDASINPGSSGGPLINTNGEVVGINTAIFSPSRLGGSGFNIGIGFSTPINQVKKIIYQLKEQGKVERGALGVIIQQVTEDIKIALNLEKIKGALVADVLKGSTAEKIGIKEGDVIVKYNDYEINDFSELSLKVSETPIGSNAKLEVIRNGKKIYLSTEIAKFDFDKENEKDEEKKDKKDYIFGFLLKNVDERLADVLQLDDAEGVIITDLDEDKVYLESDIKIGDVIKEIGGEKIRNTSDASSAFQEMQKEKPFLILLKRGKNTRYVVYKLEEKKEKKEEDAKKEDNESKE